MPPITRGAARQNRRLALASKRLGSERLPNGFYWRLRDSEILDATAATARRLVFYVSTQGKNDFRTNMPQVPLPRPQIMDVYGVSVRIFEDAATGGTVADNLLTALISTCEDSWVEFRVGTKPKLEADLFHLAPGGGAYGLVDQDTAGAPSINAVLTVAPPSPRFQAMFPLKYPARIVHGETFKVTIEWGHVVDVGGFPNSQSLIFVELLGILDRGVSTG